MNSQWAWRRGSPAFLSNSSTLSTEATVWNRKIWGIEVPFAVLSYFSPGAKDNSLSAHLHPTSPTPITMEHIRNATRAMRWAHPGIAVTVAFPPVKSLAEFNPAEGRLLYQSPKTEDEVKHWLDEVTVDVSDLLEATNGDLDAALAALQQKIPVVSKTASSWQFRVYFMGHHQTGMYAVAIQTGHVIFDGRGTFQALDLWLQTLAKEMKTEESPSCNWGEEAARLPAAFAERSAIAPTGDSTPADHPMLQNIQQSLLLPSSNESGIPILKTDAVPTYTARIHKAFPAPFADNLRRAARAQDCRLCSVFIAASWLTVLNMGEQSTTDKGKELCAGQASQCDLRPYLENADKAKMDRETRQIINAMGSSTVTGRNLERFLNTEDVISDVWTLARELQQQLDTQQPFYPTAAQWLPDFIAIVMSLMFKPAPPGAEKAPYTSVAVSSLGVMDDDLAPSYPVASSDPVLKIFNPAFSIVGFSERPSEIGAWVHPYTWNGTLYLPFSWPAAYMGTVEEQLEAEKEGEITVHAFIQKYLSLLEKLAGQTESV